MTTQTEALKLALEALENYPAIGLSISGADAWNQCQKAITAIKEALAQPKQEPVATDWERIARVQNAKLMAMCNEAGGFEKLCEVMDKYEQTTPPQRKPLTDEQIRQVMRSLGWTGEVPSDIEFARAIEAKLKEKNT